MKFYIMMNYVLMIQIFSKYIKKLKYQIISIKIFSNMQLLQIIVFQNLIFLIKLNLFFDYNFKMKKNLFKYY